MKITDAKVFVSCPGRNFVTLKIYTDQGLYGLGDATLNGRELAVASYLSDHLIPCLIGRDPSQTEDIWQYLYRGAYWRRGPVTMTAIAAIDMALWDLKGKALNTPVYNLLGGKSRTGVLVYGHANGRDFVNLAILAPGAIPPETSISNMTSPSGPLGSPVGLLLPLPTGTAVTVGVVLRFN